MAFTNKEVNIDAMAQQRKADYIASLEREMREWREEFDELYGHETDTSRSEEEMASILAGLKFKKIPEAQKKKTTDKNEPPEETYGEEYFNK